MSLLRNAERRAGGLADLLASSGFVGRAGFRPNLSGETITDTAALQVSAVWACVSILADSIASMPIKVIRDSNGERAQIATPLWVEHPNELQTGFELVHEIMLSLAIYGNAYLWVDWLAPLEPAGVQVVYPQRVTVAWDPFAQRVAYTIGGQPVKLAPAGNLVHLWWVRPPGSMYGLAPLRMHATTFGLALAMERHMAQFYAEGAVPSGTLQTDAELSPSDITALQDAWNLGHQGHRRTAVLSGGIKYQPIQVSAEDMQLAQSRDAQVGEIARIFRVPGHLIGTRGDNQTYQNVEQAGINFVRHTLLPWMRRLEDAFSSMIDPSLSVRFNPDVFLRADMLSRFHAYQFGIGAGVMSPDEARRIEDLPPRPGGEQFVTPQPPIQRPDILKT